MTKLYKKSEILFSIVFIVLYIVSASAGDMLSEKLGKEKLFTLIFLSVIASVILVFLKKNKLSAAYGLCRPEASSVQVLYYIPLLFISSVNLWFGPTISKKLSDTVFFILSMCLVGFIEEIIFRGFLFSALRKNGEKSAIAISSLTFGIGHAVNLINGNSESVTATLCQMCYCIAIGFLFVIIFIKCKSLIPQIIAHCAVNASSVFCNTETLSDTVHIITAVVISLCAVIYAFILIKTIPDSTSEDK